MKSGIIIEYIEQQKVTCAVVTDVKSKRLRLLTENNREVNISENRISHASRNAVNLSMGRSGMVTTLKDVAEKRRNLVSEIDIKELWELLNEEQEWIDLPTMAEYCFNDPGSDHESAIIRAFFENRIYFKFDHNRFMPYTPEQVETALQRQEEAERKNRIIDRGGEWLKKALSNSTPEVTEEISQVLEILKSWYIYEKESKHYEMGKAIMAKAGTASRDAVSKLLVKTGIFDEHENFDLIRMEVPRKFSSDTIGRAEELSRQYKTATAFENRTDLTHLPVITVDGQNTSDYDDALSIEKQGDSYILGIHIIDVGHFVTKGDIIDKKALARGSSIYMPDTKIPMLPSLLSDDLCSLIKDELRPCISVMITLNKFYEISDFEIIASQIRVTRQLTYTEANTLAETDKDMASLIAVAKAFRQKRLDAGAVHLSLPEVNVYLDENNEIVIKRVDRESPSRMMVAEMMIMANWLMAGHLASNGIPAVFRSQPEPKARLFKGEEHSIFQNCMQRKQLSRAVVSYKPAHHAGLGLDAYVTATSPIRRYHDLIAQRQLRALIGLEEPYTEDEIMHLSQLLSIPLSNVASIQNNRRRYWIYKYLETKNGTRTEAIVLDKRRNSFSVMLTEYMLECPLPSSGMNLKPEDMVQVVIQHANARKDALSIFAG